MVRRRDARSNWSVTGRTGCVGEARRPLLAGPPPFLRHPLFEDVGEATYIPVDLSYPGNSPAEATSASRNGGAGR